MCFGLSKHSTFRTILLRCYRVSHNNCVLDMCNPCAALTQTHPELFSTMSTILISLPTPMRRVSVCYEMELDSCHTDIQLQWVSLNIWDNLTGMKQIHATCIIRRGQTKECNFIRRVGGWGGGGAQCITWSPAADGAYISITKGAFRVTWSSSKFTFWSFEQIIFHLTRCKL